MKIETLQSILTGSKSNLHYGQGFGFEESGRWRQRARWEERCRTSSCSPGLRHASGAGRLPRALCPSTLGGSIPLFQTQQWSSRWGAAVEAESLRHQGKFWHMVSAGWRGLAKGRHPSGCGVISSPVSYRLHTSGRIEPMGDDVALVVSCQRCINLVDRVLSELLWKASQSTRGDVAAVLSVEAPLSPANTLPSYSSHGSQTQRQAELWDE